MRACLLCGRAVSLAVGLATLLSPSIACGKETGDALLASSLEPPVCPSGDTRQGNTCVGTPLLGQGYDSNIYSVFGLRGSLTRDAAHNTAVGVSVVSQGVSYLSGSLLTLRLAHLAFVGAGADGVEGGLGLDGAVGVRARFGPDHGPFARLGLNAHLLGNQNLYSSGVELPELQLGYQLLGQQTQLELGARGGFMLIGRYNALGGRRPLGDAFEFGGYSEVRFAALHLDASWSRIEARSSAPGTPVDELSGLLCAISAPFGICLDARYYSGDVRTAQGPRLAQSAYFGLSLGAGLQPSR